MADNDIKVVGLASPKKNSGLNMKVVGAIIGIVVLALGVVAGIFLVRQNQDVREKASECVEQCPGPNGALLNCHPPDANGNPIETLCNLAGKVEFCGTRNYCCPAVGGQWTADLTKCAQKKITEATATASASGSPKGFDILSGGDIPTSTPSVTPTSTASGSATPVVTKTPTSKPTIASATPTQSAFPVPETGISAPTAIGIGFGVIMLLVSLVLAF